MYPTLLYLKKNKLSSSYNNRYQLLCKWHQSSKLRIINNSQIYSTIVDTMGQIFPVGIS